MVRDTSRDEELPRKKSSRKDAERDDDDEPPKKSSRKDAERDDDDEPPKKKSRKDAERDDDDEPPKKKSRKDAERDDDDDPRRGKKKKKKERQRSPLLLIGVIVAALVALGLGVWGVYYLWSRGGQPGSGGDPAAKGSTKGSVPITKEALNKLEEGMSLEELEALLGKSSSPSDADWVKAFGGEKERGVDIIKGNRGAGAVASWVYWRARDESIFVGLAKGKTSGKDRAVNCFWVQGFSGPDKTGFFTHPGFDAGGMDPDQVAAKREERIALFNNPKWKKDEVKTLIVGKWRDSGGHGYDFAADGSVVLFIINKQTGTYKFTAADTIEINVPANQTPSKQPGSFSYRVLVNDQELAMLMLPSNIMGILLEYQRAKK